MRLEERLRVQGCLKTGGGECGETADVGSIWKPESWGYDWCCVDKQCLLGIRAVPFHKHWVRIAVGFAASFGIKRKSKPGFSLEERIRKDIEGKWWRFVPLPRILLL